MTGPLIRVTTTPFQAVRFSQSARLVSSSSVDLERRKAIARMRAFQSQHTPGNRNLDMTYVNKINRTFSTNQPSHVTSPASGTNPADNMVSDGASFDTSISLSAPSKAAVASSPASEGTAVASTASQQVSSSAPAQTSDVQIGLSGEKDSAYTVDRGAFEFRVATGELSFLPPLVMTVITQRPEVHFEYMGGYNYVAAGIFDRSNWNLTI